MTGISLSALARPYAKTAGRQWIESPAYDLSFFILAPLLGLAVLAIAPSGPSYFVLAIGAFIGIPHYLSTFTFYLWSENRDYHRAHWIAFFAAPVLIAGTIAAGMALGFWDVLKFIAYFWNAFHIARQSCGILSIYRHNAGVNSPRQKHAANVAILVANACCAIWSVHLNPNIYPFLLRVSAEVQSFLRVTFLIATVIALGWLAVQWRERYRTGAAPTVAEVGFLLASIVMFVPYLWIEDWNRAIFGVLVGHFVQYLALVWLVNRRRFSLPGQPVAERMLHAVSVHPAWLIAFSLVSGSVFVVGPMVFGKLSLPLVWEWFGGALVMLHFYLDGLFWAFKRPHVRTTLAPFLSRGAA